MYDYSKVKVIFCKHFIDFQSHGIPSSVNCFKKIDHYMAIFPFGILKMHKHHESIHSHHIHNQKIWCKNGKIQKMKIHIFPKSFQQPKARYHSLENV